MVEQSAGFAIIYVYRGARWGDAMRSTEQKICIVNATMAMEGMPLTDEDKERLRDIFIGKTTVEETVQDLVKKHSQKVQPAYERVWIWVRMG